MPTVIGLLALLSGGIAALITSLVASSHNTADQLRRRQSFYVCDGAGRAVQALAQEYFRNTEEPTSDGLQAYVLEAAGAGTEGLLAPGYTLESFTVSTDGEVQEGVIPNGPFRDMSANITGLELALRARGPGGHVCANRMSVSLGQVGLYQFFLFADKSVVFAGRSMVVEGRIHTNEELCAGSGGTATKLYQVTVAGQFHHIDNCEVIEGSSVSQDGPVEIWNGSAFVDVDATLDAESDGWREFATTSLGGHVQDSAHGVNALRIPFTTNPAMQDGIDESGAVASNAGSFRFYIDPVIVGEDLEVSQERLAWKADLRIINGVWYRNDGTFPGVPIWSDHPGSYATDLNQDGPYVQPDIQVGQEDLGFGVASPQHYSYYEREGGVLVPNDEGVISYGGLYRDTDGSYRPGFWLASQREKSSGRPPLCSIRTDGTTRDAPVEFLPYDFDAADDSAARSCGLCGDAPASLGAVTRVDGASCTAVRKIGSTPQTPSKADFLLEATRSGFLDHRVRLDGNPAAPATTRGRARILPLNFDVGAFAAAMMRTDDHELGSHFEGGTAFNGIVWIGSFWPGQMDGLGAGLAQLWPAQGEQIWDGATDYDYAAPPTGIAEQIPPGAGAWIEDTYDADRRSQYALPYPLCSTDDKGAPFTATREGDGVSEMPLYQVPSCDAASPTHWARPNALRLFHAAHIPKGLFPRGLTVATNLPVYLLGDVNTGSNVEAQWVPLQVGGDAATLLSKSWDDGNADPNGAVHWAAVTKLTGTGQRDAVETTYRVALFTGGVRGKGPSVGGRYQNFLRLLERWGNQKYVFRGAMVDGFASVFQNQHWRCCDYYGAPDLRDWSFDPKLSRVIQQPPGSPLFDVSAIRSWKRD